MHGSLNEIDLRADVEKIFSPESGASTVIKCPIIKRNYVCFSGYRLEHPDTG